MASPGPSHLLARAQKKTYGAALTPSRTRWTMANLSNQTFISGWRRMIRQYLSNKLSFKRTIPISSSWTAVGKSKDSAVTSITRSIPMLIHSWKLSTVSSSNWTHQRKSRRFLTDLRMISWPGAKRHRRRIWMIRARASRKDLVFPRYVTAISSRRGSQTSKFRRLSERL